MAQAVEEDARCPKCGFRLREGMTLYDNVMNGRGDDTTECPGCGTHFHNKNWRSRTFERQQERIETALIPRLTPEEVEETAIWQVSEGGPDRLFEDLQAKRPEFFAEIQVICRIALAKGHDYSGDERGAVDNLRASRELGIDPWVGCLLRLNDKVVRLKRYVRSGKFQVKDEGVLDTLRDIANYALLASTLFQEDQEEEGG